MRGQALSKESSDFCGHLAAPLNEGHLNPPENLLGPCGAPCYM